MAEVYSVSRIVVAAGAAAKSAAARQTGAGLPLQYSVPRHLRNASDPSVNPGENQRQTGLHPERRGVLIALLTLALGLVVTLAIWLNETQRLALERESGLAARASAVVAEINRHLAAYEVALRGGASLFAVDPDPSPDQWRAYADALRLEESFPGVAGFAFARWLTADQVPAFERQMRLRGFPQFRVWPQGERTVLGVITYIEPYDEVNAPALGYDMYSDPVRQRAMLTSLQTGRAMLTGPVTLVQDIRGAGKAGNENPDTSPPDETTDPGASTATASVLLYVPIRSADPSPSPSPSQRDAKLLGWAYAPLRPVQMFSRIARASEIAIRVYDEDVNGVRTLLFSDPLQSFLRVGGHVQPQVLSLDFASRRWIVEVMPSSDAGVLRFWEERGLAYAISGLLVSLLVAGIVWSMASTRDRARALALRMTEALRISNQGLDLRVRERTAELQRINDHLRDEVAERARAERARGVALEREATLNRQLRSLADAGLGLASLASLDAHFELLADQACRIVGCAHALAVQSDAADPVRSLVSLDGLTPAARKRLMQRAVRWPASLDPGASYRRWTEALPVLRHGEQDAVDEESEVVAIPIVAGLAQPRGWLYLVQPSGKSLGDDERAILRQLSLLAATSIRSAELVAEERQARRDAEAANRSKDEFLAIVSHELRTPLHAILSWLGVIERRGTADAKLAHALAVIRRNGEAQSVIIDDLLDLARVEKGKLEIEHDQIDLGHVVHAVVESQRTAAADKGIELELQIESGGLVRGDMVRLQQVVGNLVGNAVKFTQAGGRVRVRLCSDDDEDFLRVDVADTGVGIAPELLEHVFDRFAQADTSSRRRQGGLGLGLALVRHLAELHGGRVRASSEGEGRGSTFSVWLPRMRAVGADSERQARFAAGVAHGSSEAGSRADATIQAPSAWPAPGTAHQPAGLDQADAPRTSTRPRVMILDDYEDVLVALADLLEDEGYDVVGFESVGRGLEWLARAEPAAWPFAVICDIEMPERDGYAFVEGLRELEHLRHADTALPVIAFSAYPGSFSATNSPMPDGTPRFVAQVPKLGGTPRLLMLLEALRHGGSTV